MIGKEKQRCRELCDQAANEYGPQNSMNWSWKSTPFWKKGNDSCSSSLFPGLTLPAGRMPDFCRT